MLALDTSCEQPACRVGPLGTHPTRKIKSLTNGHRQYQPLPKVTNPRAHPRENARPLHHSRTPMEYALSAANGAPPTALVRKFERLSEPLTSCTYMRFSSM